MEGGPRLFMLETIREYGLECLELCGELEKARSAHAAYFLALAEEARAHIKGVRQSLWQARLEDEQENIRTALQWLVEREETALLSRFFAALRHYRTICGHQEAVYLRTQSGEKACAVLQAEMRARLLQDQIVSQEQAEEAKRACSKRQRFSPVSAGLTRRELDVLRLLADGLSNVQIAEDVVISPRTVDGHLVSIYSKLYVSSRTAAVRYAREHRLL